MKGTSPCASSPCLNGATCQVTGTGSTYTCTCPSGYSGTNCQIYNACFNNPCLNGATCQSNGNSLYICVCPPAYSGTNCQQCNRYLSLINVYLKWKFLVLIFFNYN